MKYEIHHGDCLEVLRTLPAASIDAVVTDPPYGLSFMGKKWDYDVPSVEIWAECLRVLKPGGHLLAFAGTRTQHRMAVRIEDAGFKIRDMIAWVYGSGRPKSLDISKAIDKCNGEAGRLLKFTAWMRTTGLKAKQIDDALKEAGCISKTSNFAVHYFNDGQPAIPTANMWKHIRPLCNDIPAWVDELVERIEAERKIISIRNGNEFVVVPGENKKPQKRTIKITAPATDAAKQWQGWGTALKPALEPITIARKPFIGTLADNVLTHGTGALNVEKCKIDERWPANFIHDGSDESCEPLGDAGRFFYCAKASKTDRENKNTHPTVKPTALMRYLCRLVTPPNRIVLDPFMGSGSTGKAAMLEGFQFIGIERESEYVEIAKARIEAAKAQRESQLL